jgi:hypothetical protein
VFDAGRVVQDGHHEALREHGVYGRLHAAWSRSGDPSQVAPHP